MWKVLVTCPPMLGMLDDFTSYAKDQGIELVPANTSQVLTEDELIDQLPEYDGWIIGDDPATRPVFEAAKSGKLRAAVKWGIGVDNVDFNACRDLNIPITNTPGVFGGEVADLAVGLLLGLARKSYYIDREIRINGNWPKPAGISMAGKHVGVIGFGDIGRNLVKRLAGFDLDITVYDPAYTNSKDYTDITIKNFPEDIDKIDFLVLTCALNDKNRHMIDKNIFLKMKPSSMIINVARGPLINEKDLILALQDKQIAAAALDVFEIEPLPLTSLLREFPQCIFGSHNGSNTTEGVHRATLQAISHMRDFLNATA